MARWLFKTEPSDYSWDELLADGEAEWDGVRNHQAANNMRAMSEGDEAFFYRSQKDPAIVGIMKVTGEAFADPDDERFVRVKVAPLRPLDREVPLKTIKSREDLKELALVRHSRLSVMPVSDEHWRILCAMGGVEA